MSLWFVTPAWQRFELTRVVLEQRRRIIDYLVERGIEARCVVVADDANADIADELGFDVLRRPNYALGRRFNDGIEYAASQGAEWIVPIGSDSFLDPAYLLPLPGEGVIRASTVYAIAQPGRLGRIKVRTAMGAGPFMIPRSHLPRSLRPANDGKKRGVDGSTLRGLRTGLVREIVNLHPWQHVGFQNGLPPQMNSYDKLYSRLGVGEESEVAERLSEHYPPDLVKRALAACAVVEVAADACPARSDGMTKRQRCTDDGIQTPTLLLLGASLGPLSASPSCRPEEHWRVLALLPSNLDGL